tara:strand:- start:253 stop:432 length:180 start_codon:yes stop_codon:yes gene_type:complete
MNTLTDYTKGITLTKEELKALGLCIEHKITNTMGAGCNTEKFQILNGIKKRIELCKQGA